MEEVKMETEEPSKDKDVEEMETSSPKSGPSNKVFEERKYDWHEDIKPHIKIVVLGEKGCGKSSLILAATNKIFPRPNEKFVSKRYYMQVTVDDKTEECMVSEIDDWDENAERREKLYTDKDVVALLCFNGKRALDELKEKCMSQLEAHDVPVICVKIMKDIKGDDYEDLPEGSMTCCPHAKEGVQQVFQEAVKKVKGT